MPFHCPVRFAGIRAATAVLALFFVFCSYPVEAARVRDIRWGHHEGFTRCVIELDANPSRVAIENRIDDLGFLYCDLYGVVNNPVNGVVSVSDPNVRSYQSVYLAGEKRLRLAIRPERAAVPKLMRLENPPRVVVDLVWIGASSSGSSANRPSAPAPSVAGPPPSAPGGGASVSSPGSARPAPVPAVSSVARRPIVVLDPGHGGWHKGAVGIVNGRSVYEKDIVLSIANKVKARLEANGKVEVRTTRTRDVYIGLFERVQRAEQFDGDLFVSIHCNAVEGAAARRRARGLEFWYWNKNSSSSAAARYLEKLENDEGEAPGIVGTTPATRRLIGTLMADQLESMALRSAELCEVMSRAFLKHSYFRTHYRGIKSGRFKVLETYQMPSILVEIGFLSHPEESRLLVSDSFQNLTAQALAEGIELVAAVLGE